VVSSSPPPPRCFSTKILQSFPHVCYMYRLSYPSSFNHSNNIMWIIETPLTVTFSPITSYFLFLLSKHFLHYPLPRRPQSVFFQPSFAPIQNNEFKCIAFKRFKREYPYSEATKMWDQWWRRHNEVELGGRGTHVRWEDTWCGAFGNASPYVN